MKPYSTHVRLSTAKSRYLLFWRRNGEFEEKYGAKSTTPRGTSTSAGMWLRLWFWSKKMRFKCTMTTSEDRHMQRCSVAGTSFWQCGHLQIKSWKLN
jgi:hypothetical protein